MGRAKGTKFLGLVRLCREHPEIGQFCTRFGSS